ncbi:MAG: ABC transporter substrate-binding protein [Firmicutes bacterium]|nr:ABC transporter substrate-binding protein [Bacillota bacterium]
MKKTSALMISALTGIGLIGALSGMGPVPSVTNSAQSQASTGNRAEQNASSNLTLAGTPRDETFVMSDIGWCTSPGPCVWSVAPEGPNGVGQIYGRVFLNLANATQTPGVFFPEIATSWQVTRDSVIVHLRPNARWQNGQPVTSQDVVAGAVISGLDLASRWAHIDSVVADGPKTVVFGLTVPGTGETYLQDILDQPPRPAFQYDQFIREIGLPVSQIEQTIAHYFALEATDPNGAETAALHTLIWDNWYQHKDLPTGSPLAGLPGPRNWVPQPLIGDGPFEYVRGTDQYLLFKKWKGFWDAKNIHVEYNEVLGFPGHPGRVAAVLTGHVDFSTAAMTAPQENQFLALPDTHMASTSYFAQFSAFFNTQVYPFSLTPVRQAIAYVLNRQAIAKAGWASLGVPTSGTYPPYPPYSAVNTPDGIGGQLTDALDPQYATLNPYATNDATAAQLLQGAGFTRNASGQWLLPNGQPFTITLVANASVTDRLAMANAMAQMLTQFGIPTTVNGPGEWDMRFMITGAPIGNDPLSWISNNLSIAESLGDGGMIPVLAQLAAATNQVVPTGFGRTTLTEMWAQVMNQELPVLDLVNRDKQTEYSTAVFTDWPPASSPLWITNSYTRTDGLIDMMEEGYIRPIAAQK